MSAGYSGTPLAKKLGIKPGHRIYVKNQPDNYSELIAPVPESVTISKRLSGRFDMIHFFTRKESELSSHLKKLMIQIEQDGMIWISWPKKASKVNTDVTEDTIRKIAIPIGLVDIKVCAVDDIWSGLKLVIRKELRTKEL